MSGKVGYAYHANSPLVDTLTFKQSTTNRLVTARSYDLANRLTRIASTAYGSGAPPLPVAYQYQYNSANQRTRVDLADGSYWVYQYDVLGQVISGNRYWQDGTPVDGQQFNYAFDDIGNRKATGGRASAVSTYTVNRLNQYSQRTVPNAVDVMGVANPTANVTVRVLGGTTYTAARKGDYYHHPLTVGNNVYPQIEVKSLYGATLALTNRVFNPPATESFSHDLDGNLTQDGRWTYTWDGENRLIEMKRDTDTPAGARQRMVFEYDHQGRRIRKQYYTYSGGWQEQTDTIFLYDGWNLMGELDANASKARVRTYVWGLDLSGTMDGAGGVGGLLKVTDYVGGTTHHFVAYDGNGNVAALNDAGTGAITARYDYGPLGEPLRATGAMALKNPLRFSTKYTDNQSGFLYYGYRFYNATTGRWLSRDPIGEKDLVNLHCFVGNEPTNNYDRNGQERGMVICPGCARSFMLSDGAPFKCPYCGWPPQSPPPDPIGFAVCRRDFVRADCCDKIVYGIIGSVFGEDHTYVHYKECESCPAKGYGTGKVKGRRPLKEEKFNPTECVTCVRTQSKLEYGEGKKEDKSGEEATDA